jgi:hypothetical protein
MHECVHAHISVCVCACVCAHARVCVKLSYLLPISFLLAWRHRQHFFPIYCYPSTKLHGFTFHNIEILIQKFKFQSFFSFHNLGMANFSAKSGCIHNLFAQTKHWPYICIKHIKQTKSMALSPQANYTDWATATCWRNLVSTFVDRGV